MAKVVRRALRTVLIVAMLLAALAGAFVIYALAVRPTGPVLAPDEPSGLVRHDPPNEALLIAAATTPSQVATIDVFEVAPSFMDRALADSRRLLEAARANPAFVGGAVLDGLPAEVQPLEEFGFVPDRAWVALYAQWEGRERRGHTSTARGRAILSAIAAYAPWAQQVLADPAQSLYEPTLIDATGELCDHRLCLAGRGVGPLIDEANSRATFINIFTTTPDRQQALLEKTYDIMPTARQHEGYLRTALHRSLDGTRVANVGQYETYRQIGDMYYHLKTLGAFGQVFVSDVTTPLFCLGLCIGDYPRLRTYRVREVVGGQVVPPFGTGNKDDTAP